MTLRTALALTALTLTLSACGKVQQCEAVDESRSDCLDQATANGVDTTYYAGSTDCSQYGGFTRIDPILGPILASDDPDFDCQQDAWDDADCTTAEGLAAAQAESDGCY